MVKVTGRTRDAAHLHAHLSYISRNGQLEGEGRDGLPWCGRMDVLETASAWAWTANVERRRRDAPLSVSLILSMPAGTDAFRLRDAARAFAREVFEDRHDYVLVLHNDTPHPHVHVTVSARGDQGERLNPKKADLEAWRQVFAQALRDRGVEAEATPRRARGVTRKGERGPVRRLRERYAKGRGEAPRVLKSALLEAARIAGGGATAPAAWDLHLARRQASIRGLYRAQVEVLARSENVEDRRLAAALKAFVAGMPAPDTQRLALARALRDAGRAPSKDPPSGRSPER
jgi:type IV secretory pathway VirD2 relaxase